VPAYPLAVKPTATLTAGINGRTYSKLLPLDFNELSLGFNEL